jgi:hypothetical protein
MLSRNFDIIKNQSVYFTGSETTCTNLNDIEYKTLVNADDVTQVQFNVFPNANAEQLIYNSDFVTDSSGWDLLNMSWAGGVIRTEMPVSGSGYMILDPNNLYAPFGENALMRVEVKVNANTYGIALFAGSENLIIPAGQIGVFELYGMYTSSDNQTAVTWTSSQIDTDVQIDYVKAYAVDLNYVFLVRNLADNTVVRSWALYQYLNGSNPYGSEPFRRIGNNITLNVDYTDLEISNGCYQIEVCDPSINTNLQNGLPNQDFNYLQTEELDFDSANIAGAFNGDSKILLTHVAGVIGYFQIVTNVAPIAGLTYNYTVTFTDVNLGTGGITLNIGFTADNDSQVVAGNGNKTGSFISDGGQLTFQIAMSGNATCKVSIARLYLQNENDLQGNYISTKIKLNDNVCDTVVLHGCSDVDYAFGLNFGSSSFDLRARVEGAIVNPQYTFEAKSYTYGVLNNTRTAYFKRKKVKQLKLALLPEYMLDFVTALIGLDHIYVDNTEYQLNGEEFFSLQYDGNLDNAGLVTLQLLEVDSTIESKACVSLGIGCSDDTVCVLNPEDDLCLIDPQTNDALISLE